MSVQLLKDHETKSAHGAKPAAAIMLRDHQSEHVNGDQPEATVVMHYKDIQLAKPEAKQFDAPAGFTKHESMEKLMQAAMMKTLGGK